MEWIFRWCFQVQGRRCSISFINSLFSITASFHSSSLFRFRFEYQFEEMVKKGNQIFIICTSTSSSHRIALSNLSLYISIVLLFELWGGHTLCVVKIHIFFRLLSLGLPPIDSTKQSVSHALMLIHLFYAFELYVCT